MMNRILFLCSNDSPLSAMAQGLACQIFGDEIEVMSAGFHPSDVNPHAIAAMAENGIDISGCSAKSLEDIDWNDLDLVVTFSANEVIPIVPEQVRCLHWPIYDPTSIDPALTAKDRTARFAVMRDQLRVRIEVLNGLLNVAPGPPGKEFHSSIRVSDLPASTRFYAWLLNIWPKEWTHRYATFIRPDLNLNFVLLVSDNHELHHDTLYHLGIGVADRDAVISAYHLAVEAGAHVEKPPRTTWKGTPLHELWLKDPDGNLIEIYARLNAGELAQKPVHEEPEFLVPGTAP